MYNKHIQKKRKKKKKGKKKKKEKKKLPQEKQTFTLNKSIYTFQALVLCKC
jgi:hypothetical protein